MRSARSYGATRDPDALQCFTRRGGARPPIDRRRCQNVGSTGQGGVWSYGPYDIIPSSTGRSDNGNFLRERFRSQMEDAKTPFFGHQHRDCDGQMLPFVESYVEGSRKDQATSSPPHGDSGSGWAEKPSQTCPGKEPSRLEPSEGFRPRKGRGRYAKSLRKSAQQTAGEEVAPASPINETPKLPAEDGQEEQVPEREQCNDEPAEEDAELVTQDDQDRKRQSDDSMEQNDLSPPESGQ